MTTDADVRAAEIVRYPIDLSLPDGPPAFLADAAEAVRQEYRNSVKWKRLRCRAVSPVVEKDGEAIFVLEIGQSIEFDWTWEGSVAFRPGDIDSFEGNGYASNGFFGPKDETEAGAWSGEVVEVDEVNGRIFVWVSDPDCPPTTGSFYVRPFEFLAFLHSIYCDPANAELRELLPARLNACRGEVHPPTAAPGQPSLPQLQGVWDHQWGVLWGPPGTGKTYTIGQQIAACLDDPSERILIVSTTNKATDEAALSCGRAARDRGLSAISDGKVLRIGKSAHYEMFEEQGFLELLKGTETDLLHQIGVLTKQLHKASTHEEKAVLRQRIQAFRRQMKDASFNIFTLEDVKVVLATSFKAITLLNDGDIRSAICEGSAPFTTVIIDEAGLISRATAAALSLLASRRVVLTGDPKQLAPISKISRILPTNQATWLASSGLNHLRSFEISHPAIHLLKEQHRMHPHVSAVVSAYQYDNRLLNGSTVRDRKTLVPKLIEGQPRALWYVLDEDGDDLPSIRAERGPGNRSWYRPKTRSVLKKFFGDEAMRKAKGLFISPFVAQARDIRNYLAEENLESWSAATVHSQQGTEADIVVFDTVNAGSCGWPYDEWKRLVNVGLSRAKEFVLLLASRSEMREPYLKQLTFDLAPRIIKWSGNAYKFVEVPAEVEYEIPDEIAENPDLIGNQLEKRKLLRPVLSFEQQRLCDLKLDGKPRLVRGVAGSGKTVVLAHWLLRTMQRLNGHADAKLWAVYANRSLQKLISDTIEEAWKAEGNGQPFPWGRVELCHIKDLLELLLPQVGLRMRTFEFDYDKAAAAYLHRRPADEVAPVCHAMFIDEAQDMGPNTLKLLSALVKQTDEDDPNSRSVNIFYDNAQNVYGRSTPKWSELGLDMRGRSSVMKESFRSTRPITEFALNVLYRLQPPESDTDHKELVERGLIERTQRNAKDWWNVRFNQVDGPQPIFRRFTDLDQEFDSIGDQIISWIEKEGVKPSDICVIYNNQRVAWRMKQHVEPKLNAIGVQLVVETGQAFSRDPRSVTVTTSHSFKGYDAEVVVIPGVDQFVAQGTGILANNLYVAMTRARSILAIYGLRRASVHEAQIMSVLQECLELLVDRADVDKEISNIDEFEDVVERIGQNHRSWLANLWKKHWIEQEPILAEGGEIVAEPVFWFQDDQRTFACFGSDPPGKSTQFRLEDAGIQIIRPGDEIN